MIGAPDLLAEGLLLDVRRADVDEALIGGLDGKLFLKKFCGGSTN